MSFEKVAELAEEFVIKIAEYQYADSPPPNVKTEDLTWLDEEAREEVKAQGKNPEYKPFDRPHNPPGAVGSEKIWNRAKKAVKPYFKNYDEPWAVTMHVYHQMHGKSKKKSKKKKK
jgi:hypothetical protein